MKIVLKMYFKYLILLLIFKNIGIILPFPFEAFNLYAWVFIPITYLVVKYTFIHELEKNRVLKRYYFLPVLIGYTLLNLILGMPFFYAVGIIIFIIILKGPYVVDEKETARYIDQFYENNKK